MSRWTSGHSGHSGSGLSDKRDQLLQPGILAQGNSSESGDVRSNNVYGYSGRKDLLRLDF